MECTVYGRRTGDNPMLTERLKDYDIMGRMLLDAGEDAVHWYQGLVAKDTGALAASPFPYLTVGGEQMDRIVCDVISGMGTPRGGYGASHEFGIGIHPRSRVPPTIWMPQDPVDDWVKVLNIMAYYSSRLPG